MRLHSGKFQQTLQTRWRQVATGEAMVCLRGESPTHPKIQMAIFHIIIGLATAVGMSCGIYISNLPASAQSMRCSTNSLGHTDCRSSEGTWSRLNENSVGSHTIRETSYSDRSNRRCSTNSLGHTNCY